MSKITQPISSQAFEFIRDRIFEIIVDEFDGQHTLTTDDDLELNVFLERNTPLDKTEISSIVISLATGSFGNKHQGSVDGTYQFHIDFFTNSKTNSSISGDTKAALKLHKIMGLGRAILEDPIYKTLGFVPPFIMKTWFSEFNIAAGNKEDALNSAMSRLIFNVVANETSKLIVPNLIEGYKTSIKIDSTGKGYFYE